MTPTLERFDVMPTMNELENIRDLALEQVEHAKRDVTRAEKRYAASTLWFRVGAASSAMVALSGLVVGWGLILAGVMVLFFNVMMRDSNMLNMSIQVKRARARRDEAYDAFSDAVQAVEDRRTLQLLHPDEYDRLETEHERMVRAAEQLRHMQLRAKRHHAKLYDKALTLDEKLAIFETISDKNANGW